MKVGCHRVLATDCWSDGDARAVNFLGVHMLKEQCGRHPNRHAIVRLAPTGRQEAQAGAVEDVDEITIPNAWRCKSIKHRISDLVDKRVLRNIVGGEWGSKAVANQFPSWAPAQPRPASLLRDA